MTNFKDCEGKLITIKGRDILISIILLQILFIILVVFDWLNIEIPTIFRQVVGFIYLTFIPGFLLLCILKILDRLSISEIILYSIGLSFFVIIIVSISINTILPLIGIVDPINEKTIVIAFVVTTLIFTIIFQKLKPEFNLQITFFNKLYIIVLLFLLLPIFSVIGTLILYFNNNNIIILIILFILSVIPILVRITSRSIQLRNLYPMLIWVCALSLVLYNSIFGEYMRPTDNLIEFYFSKIIIENKVWDITIPNNINAMAGVVIVLSIYRLIMNCNLIWIYKIYIPIISSFIPVGLYKVFEKKMKDSLYAFYSSFFFISLFIYFTWASITMKMISSGIFITLLITLIFSKLDIKIKKILSIIFTFLLILSHYGTSYIFMFSLIIALTLKYITLNVLKFKYDKNYLYINNNYILLYMAFVVGWYIYTTTGTNFESIVLIGRHLIETIQSEFLLPKNSYGVQALVGKFPIYLEIMKLLYIIAYIFIIIGLYIEIKNIFIHKKINEYILISIPLTVFIILPYVTGVSQYAGGRMWLISCYFLAPFFVKGFIDISKELKSNLKYIYSKIFKIEIFLCIFLLFNSGCIAEVIWHHNISASVYISKPRISTSGSIEEKEYFDRVYLSSDDIACARWLSIHMIKKNWIFCGENAEQNLLFAGLTPGYTKRKVGTSNVFRLTTDVKRIGKNTYVYLTEFNTHTGKIKYSGGTPKAGVSPKLFNLTEIYWYIDGKCNKIYTNGGDVIYYKD